MKKQMLSVLGRNGSEIIGRVKPDVNQNPSLPTCVGLTPDLYALQRGFTLIELLVVVLIIGILAAVALPQYQKAVAKARMTQLVTLANSVAQAEERYYLANNTYTIDWSELDIGLEGAVTSNAIESVLTNPAGWKITLNAYVAGSRMESIDARDSRLPSGTHLVYMYDNATTAGLRGKRYCYARQTNALGNLICKNATNRTSPSGETTSEYLYQF